MFHLFKRKSATVQKGGLVAPSLPLDVSAPDFVADPNPTFDWLRQHAPVVELAGGGYLLSKHSDVLAAFTDKRLGNAPSRFSTLAPRNQSKYVAAALAAHIPPFLDDEAHKPVRQMVSRAFFNTFKGFDSEIERLARDQLSGVQTGDDLIACAAEPFALRVMMRFCGVTAATEEMKMLTQAFFHLFAPLRDPQVFAEVNAAMALFRELIAKALADGPHQGSLLYELKNYQQNEAALTMDHVIDNCLLVFADGVENIEAAAGSLLFRFEAEGIFGDLRVGTIVLESAIEEGLRLDTPASFVPRVARESFALHGVEIKKDMPVFLSLASANRDEEVFENASDFNVQRDCAPVVTFGQGRHRCIGEPLAKAQLTEFLRIALELGLRPAQSSIAYHARVGHRWPQSLSVKRDL